MIKWGYVVLSVWWGGRGSGGRGGFVSAYVKGVGWGCKSGRGGYTEEVIKCVCGRGWMVLSMCVWGGGGGRGVGETVCVCGVCACARTHTACSCMCARRVSILIASVIHSYSERNTVRT